MERNVQFLPNTNDWYGRWRSVINADNDYMLDRDVQRSLSFSGIPRRASRYGCHQAWAMVDRTREHLGPSDRMIVICRRLLSAVRAFINHELLRR